MIKRSINKAEMKESILNVLRHSPHKLTKTQISGKIPLSQPTTSKYCDILAAEKKLFVQDMGIVHLVGLKNHFTVEELKDLNK